jgi:hypothetical protein
MQLSRELGDLQLDEGRDPRLTGTFTSGMPPHASCATSDVMTPSASSWSSPSKRVTTERRLGMA